jgi:hypothetical protein
MIDTPGATGSAESERSPRSPHASGRSARAPRLDVSERQYVDTEALAHVGSWEWDAVEDRSSWSDEMCRIYGQPLGFTPTYAEFRACAR